MSRFAKFAIFILVLITWGISASGCGRYETEPSKLTGPKDVNGSRTKTSSVSAQTPIQRRERHDKDQHAVRAEPSCEAIATQVLPAKPCEYCHQTGKCRTCAGTGLIPCLVCGTTGELDQFNPGSISNDLAPTFIKVPCRFCFGGKKTCVICNGTTICTHCNGKRTAK